MLVKVVNLVGQLRNLQRANQLRNCIIRVYCPAMELQLETLLQGKTGAMRLEQEEGLEDLLPRTLQGLSLSERLEAYCQDHDADDVLVKNFREHRAVRVRNEHLEQSVLAEQLTDH